MARYEHGSDEQARALRGALVQARKLLQTLVDCDAPEATIELAARLRFVVAADSESADEARA